MQFYTHYIVILLNIFSITRHPYTYLWLTSSVHPNSNPYSWLIRPLNCLRSSIFIIQECHVLLTICSSVYEPYTRKVVELEVVGHVIQSKIEVNNINAIILHLKLMFNFAVIRIKFIISCNGKKAKTKDQKNQCKMKKKRKKEKRKGNLHYHSALNWLVMINKVFSL